MTVAQILKKIRSFASAGWRHQALVAEASAAMLVARLRLARKPFVEVARGIGEAIRPDDPRAARAKDDDDAAQVAREIGWAVTAAAPFMPFRSVCLQQAMAAQVMLRRRGIASVMHFGVKRGAEKPLEAHAWLDAAGVRVTGYPIPEGMGTVASFV